MVPLAVVMVIVAMGVFFRYSNTGTVGTVIVACASVEAVGAVLETARTVCL